MTENIEKILKINWVEYPVIIKKKTWTHYWTEEVQGSGCWGCFLSHAPTVHINVVERSQKKISINIEIPKILKGLNLDCFVKRQFGLEKGEYSLVFI